MKTFNKLKISVPEERMVIEQINYITKGLKGGARFKREFCASLHTGYTRPSTGGYHGGGKRGQYPRIKITTNALREGIQYFNEYKRIEKSSIIGAFWCEDAADVLWQAVLAHEIAHAIVETAKKVDWLVLKPEWIPNDVGTRTWQPHGLVWQRVYGVLREEYVNEHMDKVGIKAINHVQNLNDDANAKRNKRNKQQPKIKCNLKETGSQLLHRLGII